MKTSKTKAIILHSKHMFEKDKLINVFSYELGKTRFLAKNASTSKFKFGGKLEATNLVEVEFFQKNSFYILSDCSILQTFANLRTNFNKISLAFYFFEIISKATHLDQPAPQLFNLLLTSLEQLNQDQTEISIIKNFFEKQFLIYEGLLAENTSSQAFAFKQKYLEYTGCLLQEPHLI